MATKIEIKKADVGYTKVLSRCGNCASFSSQIVMPAWMVKANESADSGDELYIAEKNLVVEKNMRCSVHGFAIQRTAVCNFWNPKPPF
jgi:hypothetical protein